MKEEQTYFICTQCSLCFYLYDLCLYLVWQKSEWSTLIRPLTMQHKADHAEIQAQGGKYQLLEWFSPGLC
jgi:hypothetical protein